MDWLNWVFPKKCVNCGRFGAYVCDECEVGMWEEEQICPSCGRNSRYGLRHKYCRGEMEGVVCLWAYEGIARKLISGAKYGHYFDYLNDLLISDSQFLLRPEFSHFCKFCATRPIVVPVPLHAKRQRERGFNQAEIIADLVARCWMLDVRKILVRTKDTGQQVGKPREERLKAMEGAFRVNSNFQLPRNKQHPIIKYQLPINVLLVDDVWTTGATLRECAKVLRKGGVKRVWGLVLAR